MNIARPPLGLLDPERPCSSSTGGLPSRPGRTGFSLQAPLDQGSLLQTSRPKGDVSMIPGKSVSRKSSLLMEEHTGQSSLLIVD